MYTIYYVCEGARAQILSGFASMHEALAWLVQTYTEDAELWKDTSKISIEKDR